mgnify:CR=1 FL=1
MALLKSSKADVGAGSARAVELAAEAGVEAIIQPGGSMRDEEVFERE